MLKVIAAIAFSSLVAACSGSEETPSASDLPSATATPRATTPSFDAAFSFCPTWRQDDSIVVEFARRVEISGSEGREEQATQAGISVVEISNDGYVFEWVNRSPDLGPLAEAIGFDPAGADLLEVAQEFSEIPFLVETDECGAFIGIRNWHELQDGGVRLMDTLAVGLAEESGEDLEGLRDTIHELLSTQEATEAIFARWPALYFSPYGIEIGLDELIEFETYLPNPLGGPPLLAKGTFELALVEPGDRCAELIQEAVFDPSGLADSFQAVADRLQSQAAGSDPEVIGSLSLADHAEFTVCAGEPWIASLLHERLIVAEGHFNRDTREVNVIP